MFENCVIHTKYIPYYIIYMFIIIPPFCQSYLIYFIGKCVYFIGKCEYFEIQHIRLRNGIICIFPLLLFLLLLVIFTQVKGVITPSSSNDSWKKKSIRYIKYTLTYTIRWLHNMDYIRVSIHYCIIYHPFTCLGTFK